MSAPLLLPDEVSPATKAVPVFSDLTVAVPRGALTVVVGPAGGGRSALLLAACGRMRGLSGTVRLGSHRRPRPAPADGRRAAS